MVLPQLTAQDALGLAADFFERIRLIYGRIDGLVREMREGEHRIPSLGADRFWAVHAELDVFKDNCRL